MWSSCIRNDRPMRALLVLLSLGFLATTAFAETVTIKRNGVMLREGPGNYYKMLGVLNNGATGELKGENESWRDIQLEAMRGWISANALSTPPTTSTMSFLHEAKEGSEAQVIPVSVMVASIKGLTAKRKSHGKHPERFLNPPTTVPFEMHQEFRRSMHAYRGKFKMVRDWAPGFSPDDLVVMSVLAAEDVEELGGINRIRSDYASMILMYIADVNGATGVAPQVFITNKGQNAYSYPGGIIVIGGGLVDRMVDEAQLAAVLAHEMSHILLRHGETSMKKEAWRGSRKNVFDRLDDETTDGWDTDEETDAFLAEVEAKADDVHAMVRRYKSFSQEIEADSLSTELITRAGYDPDGMFRFLDRLNREYGDQFVGRGINMSWIQERDELVNRIDVLKKNLKKTRKRYKKMLRKEEGALFENRFGRYSKKF